MRSLTARFVAVNLAVIAMVLGIITAVEYNVARRQIDLMADARLASAGHMLRALMDEELDSAATNRKDDLSLISPEDRKAFSHEVGKHVTYDVWYQGTLAERSGGPSFAPPKAEGLRTDSQTDGAWRVFSLVDQNADVAISVSEPLSERQEIIWRSVRDLVLPGLLLIPGTLIALWAVARDGLGRTRQFAALLAKRSSNDLSLLQERGWPSEFKPLITATNSLLARMEAAFETERRVVDLAAHQLRTPLASILVQAQSARRLKDAASLQKTLGRLEATVLQATNLTDRLLALARLEADSADVQCTDLRPELEHALIEVLPIAEEREQTVTVKAVPQAPVWLNPADCRLICSCLLENAVKYSPRGSAIAVDLSRHDGLVEFAVEDEGPGIPVEERDIVLERFQRGRSGSGTAGSGLGLSIVVAGAKRAGGMISLESASHGSGLLVRLRLPECAAMAPEDT